MRKEYGAALRRGFATAMRAAFPEFAPITVRWWQRPDPLLDSIEAGRAPDEAALRAAVERVPAARAAADVAPGIAEAIELLRTWGVPHLRRIAAERR